VNKKPRIQRSRETYFVGIFRKNKLTAIKIGLASRGKTAERIRNLQTGSIDKLTLLAVVEGSLERKFHRQFAGYRLPKGEFFRPSPMILRLIDDLKVIRDLVDQVEALPTTRGIKGTKT